MSISKNVLRARHILLSFSLLLLSGSINLSCLRAAYADQAEIKLARPDCEIVLALEELMDDPLATQTVHSLTKVKVNVSAAIEELAGPLGAIGSPAYFRRLIQLVRQDGHDPRDFEESLKLAEKAGKDPAKIMSNIAEGLWNHLRNDTRSYYRPD